MLTLSNLQGLSMGPPSSGGVALLQILGVMSHFDLSTHDIDDARVIHLITDLHALLLQIEKNISETRIS